MKYFNLHSTYFEHHRKGWSVVADILHNYHSSYSLIHLYDWADWQFREKQIIEHPWAGFLHNVLDYPVDEMPEKYQKSIAIMPLRRLVDEHCFRESLNHCYGIFTLSKYTANFLAEHVDVPVSCLWHPVELEKTTFQMAKFISTPNVVMLGQWMRRYISLYELKTNYHKQLVITKDFMDYQRLPPKDVTILPYLSNDTYDTLLSSSVIFLDLYDMAACNVVLECIVRNTPLLINILPTTLEYLGVDYPFFYRTIEEASEKLHNLELITRTHEYLLRMDKSHLTPDSFVKQFESSTVYNKLLDTKI
jgi:hypothetical protein